MARIAVLCNTYSFRLHSQQPPFWHQNKPSRELDFCGRADEWWPKMALIMLKFMLKSGQKLEGVSEFVGQ